MMNVVKIIFKVVLNVYAVLCAAIGGATIGNYIGEKLENRINKERASK